MIRDEAAATGPELRESELRESPQHRAQDAQDATGTVDLAWARRQRGLAVAGAGVAVVALCCTIVSLIGYRARFGAPTWQLGFAIAAAGVLALCCVVLVVGWQQALKVWRSAAGGDLSGWIKLCFGVHLLSYVAVLAAMYGAVAESALVGWSSSIGFLLGIAFILVIAAQSIGGTQYVRHQGLPGTIPNYLRKLNDKVQSLR